jgi:hypothetical protein
MFMLVLEYRFCLVLPFIAYTVYQQYAYSNEATRNDEFLGGSTFNIMKLFEIQIPTYVSDSD